MPKTATKTKEAKVVLPFSAGDFVVYPAHGVGKVTSIEAQTIAGQKVELFVISFERDRMTLRVPVRKVENSGLRKLSTRKVMEAALTTLKGRARVKRAMWSRRAQEYEAKINSGDPVSIAEVVRDLHRGASQPEQSYSERQIYEQALERLFIDLAFAVGLFGLRSPTVQVAHHFGDRHGIARVDLGFVFLGAAAPHGALDARAAFERRQRRFHDLARGEFAQAGILHLAHRNAQGHAVALEADDEQLDFLAGDGLGFDAGHFADAVRRIHHKVPRRERQYDFGFFCFCCGLGHD